MLPVSRRPQTFDLSTPEWSEALRKVFSIPQEERDLLKTKPWDLLSDVWTYFRDYFRGAPRVRRA